MRVKYLTDLSKLSQIPDADREVLKQVTSRYAFRINDYYLGLIDWHDPQDPIRRLVIPSAEELQDSGRLDASDEHSNSPLKGVQHKYPDTVLLLCNEVCGAYCRYCFRKRLFMKENQEVSLDVSAGLAYIRAHPEVSNVLLTGGDPLMLGTKRLRQILHELRRIEHVQIIRIGSKMPAFNPWRILDDEELQQTLSSYSTPQKRIYLMAHFDHPRELTPAAIDGLAQFQRCGVITINQCPLVRDINDNAEVLAELFSKLSFAGVPPYYIFQCRPTSGNQTYKVPFVRGYSIIENAKRKVSGLARRAKYVMSHASGKIELVGMDYERIYMRYHRAKNPDDEGRFLIFERSDRAAWLEDLTPVENPSGALWATEPQEAGLI